jgi:hypothetical protein
LDAGGLSRQSEEWGEDVITPDMVTARAETTRAAQCTWCGAESKWLAERLIARLSQSQRDELLWRLRERCNDAGAALSAGAVKDRPRAMRSYLMLGRLAALTA